MVDVLAAAMTSIMAFDHAINTEHKGEVQNIVHMMKEGERSLVFITMLFLLAAAAWIAVLFRSVQKYKNRTVALQLAERANAVFREALQSVKVQVFIRDMQKPEKARDFS